MSNWHFLIWIFELMKRDLLNFLKNSDGVNQHMSRHKFVIRLDDARVLLFIKDFYIFKKNWWKNITKFSKKPKLKSMKSWLNVYTLYNILHSKW